MTDPALLPPVDPLTSPQCPVIKSNTINISTNTGLQKALDGKKINPKRFKPENQKLGENPYKTTGIIRHFSLISCNINGLNFPNKNT